MEDGGEPGVVAEDENKTREVIDNIIPATHFHFHPPSGNTSDVYHFVIGVISDDDENSRSKTKPNVYESKFVRGKLTWHENAKNLTVEFDSKNTKVFESKLNSGGRGMELSELIYYNDILTTFDDKTGIVYKIQNTEIFPWVILAAGDGTLNKGFKSEWATVKDEKLVVGSHGTVYDKPDAREREEGQWIKIISKSGEVEHVNWNYKYERLRNSTECSGYLIHESVAWSDVFKKWFFLPRKCSEKSFSESTYDLKSSNILISTDEHFQSFHIAKVGQRVVSQGFSSFKFLPGSDDTIIVALKTIENKMKHVQTHIAAFGLNGEILLQDTLISNTLKFEGIEFIHPNELILNYTAPETAPSATSAIISSNFLLLLCFLQLFCI